MSIKKFGGDEEYCSLDVWRVLMTSVMNNVSSRPWSKYFGKRFNFIAQLYCFDTESNTSYMLLIGLLVKKVYQKNQFGFRHGWESAPGFLKSTPTESLSPFSVQIVERLQYSINVPNLKKKLIREKLDIKQSKT